MPVLLNGIPFNGNFQQLQEQIQKVPLADVILYQPLNFPEYNKIDIPALNAQKNYFLSLLEKWFLLNMMILTLADHFL